MSSRKRKSSSSSFLSCSLSPPHSQTRRFNYAADYISLDQHPPGYVDKLDPTCESPFRKALRHRLSSTPYKPLPGRREPVGLRGGAGSRSSNRGFEAGKVGRKRSGSAERQTSQGRVAEARQRLRKRDLSKPLTAPRPTRATRLNVRPNSAPPVTIPTSDQNVVPGTLKGGHKNGKSKRSWRCEDEGGLRTESVGPGKERLRGRHRQSAGQEQERANHEESSEPTKKSHQTRKNENRGGERQEKDRDGTPNLAPSFDREWRPGYRDKKPRGLENLGLTCFLNAGLQMLLNTPVVVNFVEDFHDLNTCKGFHKNDMRRCLRCLLKRLFQTYWGPENPEDDTAKRSLFDRVRLMRNEFQKQHINHQEKEHIAAEQQLCPDEFLNWLISGIKEELEDTHFDISLLWSDLFYGLYEGFTICTVCKKPTITSKCEENLTFWHHVMWKRNGATPEQLLDDWLKPHDYSEAGPTKTCDHDETHKVNSREDHYRYLKFPEFFYILVDLSRSGSMRKDTTVLELPQTSEWDVTKYFQSSGAKNTRYTLVGIIAHRGTLKDGHFIAGVQGPSGKSFSCNDHSVKPVPDLKTWWELVKGTSIHEDFQINAYCFMKVAGSSDFIPDSENLKESAVSVQQANTRGSILLQKGFLHIDSHVKELGRREVGLFPRSVLDGQHLVQVPLHFTDGQKSSSIVLSGISNGSLDRLPDTNTLKSVAAKNWHIFRNKVGENRNIPFCEDLGQYYLETAQKKLKADSNNLHEAERGELTATTQALWSYAKVNQELQGHLSSAQATVKSQKAQLEAAHVTIKTLEAKLAAKAAPPITTPERKGSSPKSLRSSKEENNLGPKAGSGVGKTPANRKSKNSKRDSLDSLISSLSAGADREAEE